MINGPAKFVGQDGQCFSLAMFIAQFVVIFLPGFIALEEQLCGLGKSPTQMCITDFLPGRTIFFAVGLFGAFNKPGV